MFNDFHSTHTLSIDFFIHHLIFTHSLTRSRADFQRKNHPATRCQNIVSQQFLCKYISREYAHMFFENQNKWWILILCRKNAVLLNELRNKNSQHFPLFQKTTFTQKWNTYIWHETKIFKLAHSFHPECLIFHIYQKQLFRTQKL